MTRYPSDQQAVTPHVARLTRFIHDGSSRRQRPGEGLRHEARGKTLALFTPSL
jgi:hypothetical protein